MWEEYSFEFFKRITSEVRFILVLYFVLFFSFIWYIEWEIDEEIGTLFCQRIDIREALQRVKSRYFRLEKEVVKLPRQQPNKVMC